MRLDKPENKPSKTVLMVSAEASSALYALRILQSWKSNKKNYNVYGVGSKQMESCGFECLGYAEDLGVVGIREVLFKYRDIKEVYQRVLDRVDKEEPDIALLLDYPGFNLRLAKELKKRGIRVLYYIAPQVWAWKKGRVKTIRRYVDEVLCILPFEEEFYKNYGVNARFVGHPLLDELNKELLNQDDRLLKRSRFGFQEDDLILGLMPGSRHGELKYNFATQLVTAQKLYLKNPRLKIAILVAPTLERAELLEYLQAFKCPYVVIQDEPMQMIQIVDVMLCKSGTATLMVGLLEVPMVIMYRVSFLTGVIGRLVVSGFIGLVNIIMKKEVVPERVLGKATVEELSKLLQKIIDDRSYRQEMRGNLRQLKHSLGAGGVTEKVVSVVEEYLTP